MQFNTEIINSRHFVSREFRGGKPAIRGVYHLTVGKISAGEKMRKIRGKWTLEKLVNSRRGKFSSEFCGKLGSRVECIVVLVFITFTILFFSRV